MSLASKNVYLTLANGEKMPLVGLGTWKSKRNEVRDAVIAAITAGYRHIDAAYCYENEEEIGEALREVFNKGIVKREDLFITTKLWAPFHDPCRVKRGLQLSLKALQLDYVDLYLMHSAMANKYIDDKNMEPKNEDGTLMLDDIHYLDTWKAMESLVDEGLTKSIGVSNFNINQLRTVLEKARVPCVMNQAHLRNHILNIYGVCLLDNIAVPRQIENHPLLDQKALIDFCKSEKVAVTSYSPLGSPDREEASPNDPNLLKSPLVRELATAKGCTPGQILTAYSLCQGLICIPKSVTPSRIKENFLSLDVKLSVDDITTLDSLECGFRAVTWVGFEAHPHYPF